MDLVTVNTIVGCIGIIVGIIGIIVGVIGWNSLKVANKIKIMFDSFFKDSTFYTNINKGMSYKDVSDIVSDKIKSNKAINTIEDLQEILEKNKRYSVCVFWNGEQEEYDEMKENREIDSRVMYCINEHIN